MGVPVSGLRSGLSGTVDPEETQLVSSLNIRTFAPPTAQYEPADRWEHRREQRQGQSRQARYHPSHAWGRERTACVQVSLGFPRAIAQHY